ncbi:MAG: peptidoglycan DD-metalloendopeptidase family protein [Proteobacteria bacterium]|nr:peptidoglycan DD-metalloendopeptidase family protein [Pseudomonadota bacterium]
MFRNSPFNIKTALFLPLFSLSIYFLYLSYENFQNIILDQAIVIKIDDYNYFDPITFRKYYDEISIENLNSQIISKLENEELVERELKEDIQYKIHLIKINPGDNFASVLKRSGIKSKDIDKIILDGKKIYDFSKIYAGDEVKVSHNYIDNKLNYLDSTYQFSEEKILKINLKDSIYTYNINLLELTSEEVFAKGTIENSLYSAMKDLGLSEIVIEEMIRIFSFDIDFQRDIYKNDRFEILFTKFINNKGKTIRINDPIYLKLYSKGTPLTYYLFNNSDYSEYFDEKGKGMTKGLMKTPINGSKLSSGFGMRKHPISGYDKLHKGVDFAAPSGTPIFAAGNGVIEFIGNNGGYGKYIRIRHDSTYKTAYAHMKSFKKNLYKGARIKQGDVIGYVGTTGNSTGPHLHYEIIKSGNQINPQKLKLPSGRNLNENELLKFNEVKNDIERKIEFMQAG